MKKLILAVCLLLAVTVANAVNVTLAWDYPDEERTPDIQFRLYHSSDLTTWELIQTLPHDATAVTLNAAFGHNFYTMRAYSIFWELESDPSNTARTPAPPLSTNITIRKGT